MKFFIHAQNAPEGQGTVIYLDGKLEGDPAVLRAARTIKVVQRSPHRPRADGLEGRRACRAGGPAGHERGPWWAAPHQRRSRRRAKVEGSCRYRRSARHITCGTNAPGGCALAVSC